MFSFGRYSFSLFLFSVTMTTYKVLLFNALIMVLFHCNSALFYTNSGERDYPRIGKRYLNVASVLKTPNNWYPVPKVYKAISKREPAADIDDYKWGSVLYSGQEFDTLPDEGLTGDREVAHKILQMNDIFRGKSRTVASIYAKTAMTKGCQLHLHDHIIIPSKSL